MTATSDRATPHSAAVAWIDERHALVATTSPGHRIAVTEIARHYAPSSLPTFLARVASSIGDRERIVILGPGTQRVKLEHEYVSAYHRLDRLIDVEPADVAGRRDVVARVRQLAA